jgi:hypothetical protein
MKSKDAVLAQALKQLAKDAAQIVKEAAEELKALGDDVASKVDEMALKSAKLDEEIAKRINSLASKMGKVPKLKATFGTSTTTDYKKTFFAANPSQEGNVVVHHAVEQQSQILYPNVVSDSEMNSLENLRGVPKGSINNRVHLSAIRKLWNQFYSNNPNPSQQDLLDFASRIDDEFGDVFSPPLQ